MNPTGLPASVVLRPQPIRTLGPVADPSTARRPLRLQPGPQRHFTLMRKVRSKNPAAANVDSRLRGNDGNNTQ